MNEILLDGFPHKILSKEEYYGGEENGVLVIIGPWHDHLTREEFQRLLQNLEDNRIELQLKKKGEFVSASRIVFKEEQGEVLFSETGSMISPFWRRSKFEFHPLKRSNKQCGTR